MDPRGFFTLKPRRKLWNLIQKPGLQLKLPFYLLALTAAFAFLLADQAYTSYAKLVELALTELDEPSFFARAFDAQTGDLLLTTVTISLGYVLTVFVVCVTYVHRMVGPMIPIHRHVEALKNGDFASRIRLRKKDAFNEVAADLNELAENLEGSEKSAAG